MDITKGPEALDVREPPALYLGSGHTPCAFLSSSADKSRQMSHVADIEYNITEEKTQCPSKWAFPHGRPAYWSYTPVGSCTQQEKAGQPDGSTRAGLNRSSTPENIALRHPISQGIILAPLRAWMLKMESQKKRMHTRLYPCPACVLLFTPRPCPSRRQSVLHTGSTRCNSCCRILHDGSLRKQVHPTRRKCVESHV
jgi:hypothetical protein